MAQDATMKWKNAYQALKGDSLSGSSLNSFSSLISIEGYPKVSSSRMSLKGSETLRGTKRQSTTTFHPRFDHHKLVKLLAKRGINTSQYLRSLHWDEEYWVHREKKFHDDADLSQHPSYTIKNVAYNLECELLYMEAKEKYHAQFLKEMKHFITSKRKVSEQFFTRRILAYTTLWPPLHSKYELDIFKRKFFELSPGEKKRLDYLMKTKLSEI